MTATRASLFAFAVLVLTQANCVPQPERRPDIVLIVIDTLRADRVSCYGYERSTTPRIDELCASGIRFADAASTSSWTVSAHASLFTGMPAIRHGANQEHPRLAEGPSTLAEILSEHGYATLAVSANPLVSARTGMERGFERFVESWRGSGRRRHGAPSPAPERHPVPVAVRELLAQLEPGRPFFLFVNLIEAHGPYDPPEPYRSRFLDSGASPELVAAAASRTLIDHYGDPGRISAAEFSVLSDLYDGEVAYVDAIVGELVDALESASRLDGSLLVVTSDHGENLGDHGHFRHAFSLYESTVRIPLIARLPGARHAGEVRYEPVSLQDVFETALRHAGIEPPAGQDEGRDLFDAGALRAGPARFAEYYYPLQALGVFSQEQLEQHRERLAPHRRRLRSVELDGLRLIWGSDGRFELFDTRNDPKETRNRIGEPAVAERERELKALLTEFVERGGGPLPLPPEASSGEVPRDAFGELDADTAEQLRVLGYIP